MRIVANDVCLNQNWTPIHGRSSRDADIQEDQQGSRQHSLCPANACSMILLVRGQVVVSADCCNNESKHTGNMNLEFGQRRYCEHEICG